MASPILTVRLAHGGPAWLRGWPFRPAFALVMAGAFAMGMAGQSERVGPGRAAELPVPVAEGAVPATAQPAPPRPGFELRVDEFIVYVPLVLREPVDVLLVLPGMGWMGADFSQPFRNYADGAGWVVVAPTLEYGDWRNPAQLRVETGTQLPRIAAFLDQLPEVTGLAISARVLVYGFSRGGQTANRFALAFPERVAGVAIASAGTYTVPAASVSPDGPSLGFPYGSADLVEVVGRPFDVDQFAAVPFWIGVGERDSDPADIPREWDQYLGTNRVERAQRFADWVARAGGTAQVHVFAGLGHAETDEERDQALAFLERAQL